jgi:hypothetical protein
MDIFAKSYGVDIVCTPLLELRRDFKRICMYEEINEMIVQTRETIVGN